MWCIKLNRTRFTREGAGYYFVHWAIWQEMGSSTFPNESRRGFLVSSKVNMSPTECMASSKMQDRTAAPLREIRPSWYLQYKTWRKSTGSSMSCKSPDIPSAVQHCFHVSHILFRAWAREWFPEVSFSCTASSRSSQSSLRAASSASATARSVGMWHWIKQATGG